VDCWRHAQIFSGGCIDAHLKLSQVLHLRICSKSSESWHTKLYVVRVQHGASVAGDERPYLQR